jgi:hypothetical protein
MGIHVTDAWKLAEFNKIINYTARTIKRPNTIQHFAGVLGRQLILNASSLPKCSLVKAAEGDKENIPPPTLISDTLSTGISSLSDIPTGSPTVLIHVHSLSECQGVVHHQVKLPIHVGKNGKQYTKQRPCKNCKEIGKHWGTTFYCYTCGLHLVFAVQLKKQIWIVSKIMLMPLAQLE